MARVSLVGFVLVAGALEARAGGSAEDVVLVVDPADPDALRVANHYRAARGIPDRNLLYVDPVAADYPTLVTDQLDALQGTLTSRRIQHTDYVAIAPADFFVPAPGLVSDACSPINRFSVAGAWSSLWVSDDILSGNQNQGYRNHYNGSYSFPVPFDSSTGWFFGNPNPTGERYMIGTMLGYTGQRGNTVAELEGLIDQAVAMDGTFPGGTFYYAETTDPARSGPRDPFFDAAVLDIQLMGGQAIHTCCASIPAGAHDALGMMTGAANPPILTGDYTLLGAPFADHLTSFAGTFDNASQTKMSEWITAGAVGTFGTVQEPCNYPGKFPHPGIHVAYFGGLSLGESVFRSLGFFPFQGLMYGDPLARPYAHIPTVDVPGAPGGSVSGTVTLSPTFNTTHPTAGPKTTELFVDGEHAGIIAGLASINVLTPRYPDGPHDVRIRVVDDSDVESAGTWQQTMTFDNFGRSAGVNVSPGSGDLSTAFVATASIFGAALDEARLVANGRVVAATTSVATPMTVYGATLGTGDVDVHVEVDFFDGTRAVSPRQTLSVSASAGSPAGSAPLVYDATIRVPRDHTSTIQFPTTGDDSIDPPSVSVLSGPAWASLTGWDAWRIVKPNGVDGSDTIDWQATNLGGTSPVATLTLVYDPCEGGMIVDVPPLVAGATVDIDVSCAHANEQIGLLHAADTGSDPLPAARVITGLDSWVLHSASTSAADGTVTFQLTVPSSAPQGAQRLFQVLQYGEVSDVVTGTVP